MRESVEKQRLYEKEKNAECLACNVAEVKLKSVLLYSEREKLKRHINEKRDISETYDWHMPSYSGFSF